VKKVADRLLEIFKENRQEFEEKWDDIGVFIKYGALTDEKFLEKAEGFTLLKDVDKQYFLIDEYKEKTKTIQTDKDKHLIWLYTNNIEEQLPFIENIKKLEYSVLQFTDVLDSHYVGLLERKFDVQIKRVDTASADNLINKDEKKESVLSDTDIESLTAVYKDVITDDKTTIKTEALSPEAPPAIITQDEFDRRFKEMSQTGGGGFMGMADWPARFNLILNTNHPMAKKIIDLPEAESKKQLAKQLYDIARLSRNELKGKDLNDFIERSLELIMKKD
jgi:molecular chaperone HtpG